MKENNLPETLEDRGRTFELQIPEEDVETRDSIISEEYNSSYWINKPRDVLNMELTVHELKALMETGFLHPGSSHNASPSAIELFDFISQHRGFKALAIVYSPYREDCQPGEVHLDGVVYNGVKRHDYLADFKINFEDACDEFTAEPNYMRAWWD